MLRTDYTFKAEENVDIFYCKWAPKNKQKIKGIVQISHGMAEHILRYEHFAKELVDNHFIVYGHDHRGHGRTAKTAENIGYFADEAGFEKVVTDVYSLTKIIKTEHKDLPIVLFGHSMGSFIARRYIQKYSDQIAGVILSGTGSNPGLLGKIGQIIAAWEVSKKGATAKSPLLDKLSFGNFNKQFAPNRTKFDWLTRDEAEVDCYINDPYCGNIFTAGFFQDLFRGIEIINKKSQIKLIHKQLPLLLIAGSQDPVGNNGKGVWQVAKDFKRAQLENVSVKLYENARHEIINEINRQDVINDIIVWIDKIII